MGNANILIIEDDEDIREGIRILLESEDYQITEAADGWEGLRLLSDDTDLVILDIMMPGISGLKTCEEIRKTSFVPVLFLTAKAQESDKLIGLMAGGDDYLTKPFSAAKKTKHHSRRNTSSSPAVSGLMRILMRYMLTVRRSICPISSTIFFLL